MGVAVEFEPLKRVLPVGWGGRLLTTCDYQRYSLNGLFILCVVIHLGAPV